MSIAHLLRRVSIRKVLHILVIVVVGVLYLHPPVLLEILRIAGKVRIVYLLINVVKLAPVVVLLLRILALFEGLNKVLKLRFLLRECVFLLFYLLLYCLLREKPF